MSKPLIAVIEDDPAISEMLELLLQDDGYATVHHARGSDAHQLIQQTQPDLVLLDLWLEERAAGEMVLGLIELDPTTRHIPVIIYSAHVDVLQRRAELLRARNYRILKKPFRPDQLLAEIADTLAHVPRSA